ncbi:hypothetical protein MU0050_004530 [[Mycobacterium] wendilense]|uniref:Uncharacterized protein n=1 Tax=[Mycobacterium] wendilense TaxID=3064284 RepID=A0ABN9P4I3_9MYCO|nr:hypothetical protein [Mycolicibacterium sp. MU0050]CAJ1586938.1 hypothetical protein MU0050_004530 [Mycolicibacterium sp. MU0050]
MPALIWSITSLLSDSTAATLSEWEADMRVKARGATALTAIPCAAPSVARLRVSDHHPRSAGGQQQRVAAPHAAAGAGDDHDPVVETKFGHHGPLLRVEQDRHGGG